MGTPEGRRRCGDHSYDFATPGKALGYESWGGYVKAEFHMSRSHSYQLIDQGRVVRALQDAGQVSTMVDITEREARRIKPRLEQMTEAIERSGSPGCPVVAIQ